MSVGLRGEETTMPAMWGGDGNEESVTQSPNAGDVLGRPVVLVSDELVGHVSGVFFDAVQVRPIGLEVASATRPPRFLPWVAATRRGSEIVAASAFLLFESRAPYVEHGAILCREQRELAELVSADVSGAVAAGMAHS